VSPRSIISNSNPFGSSRGGAILDGGRSGLSGLEGLDAGRRRSSGAGSVDSGSSTATSDSGSVATSKKKVSFKTAVRTAVYSGDTAIEEDEVTELPGVLKDMRHLTIKPKRRTSPSQSSSKSVSKFSALRTAFTKMPVAATPASV
jgi:hypothetical protein